jgi:kumamolisin
VALRPRSATAIEEAAAVARTRANQPLTVDELGAAIGPISADIDAVTTFFRDRGFTVMPLAADHLTFQVRGSVAQTEQALGVTFGAYRDGGGQTYFSTSGDPTLPANLASTVQAIYGLDNYPALHPLHQIVQNGPGFHTPSDMRQAYNVNPLYTAGLDGTGQTIGIIGCDSFLDSDIASFDQWFGLPNVSVNRVTVDDGAQTQGPETTLDLEWSQAIGPSAALLFYGFSTAGNCSFGALLDTMSKVVSDNRAGIVNISLGACEDLYSSSGYLVPLENEFAAAAALGQGVFVASGDSGAYAPPCPSNVPKVSYPASSAFVTAVGGTTLLASLNGTYQSESAWGSTTECNGPCGTGGGISTAISEPAWQSSASILSTGGKRGVPDIAWNADPATGNYIFFTLSNAIGCTGKCGGVGGTSIASPQWAGLAALANQAAGKRVGQWAPLLYSKAVLARQTSGACAPYHDVTAGNNLNYQAGPGWDLTTGWGSPNAYRLLEAIVPTIPTGLSPSVALSPSAIAAPMTSTSVTTSRLLLPFIPQLVQC